MEVLRIKDIMELLSVSRSTIWRWSKQPDFPSKIQLGGNTVGWFQKDLFAWLESRVVPPMIVTRGE